MPTKHSANPPRLLHHDASPATLVFVLKFMFAIWFLRYLFDPLQQLALLPVEYTDPVGWMNWLPLDVYKALHSFGGLLLLRLLILAACLGVWFCRTRLPSALLGCLLITTACAISRGFGHLNHAELGPLLVTWVLTIFALRLPVHLVQRPDHDPQTTAAAGLITATIALSLVYALVGIARLSHGGIDLLAGDTITNRMVHMSHHDWLMDYNYAELVLRHPSLVWLIKVGTAVVTVVEVITPFCLISRRIRYVVLILMPAFHIGAIVLFKVVFIEQPLTLILLINLTPWLAQRKARGRGWAKNLIAGWPFAKSPAATV